jgi:hypothetical protein
MSAPEFTVYVITMPIPPSLSARVHIVERVTGMERLEPWPGSTHAVRLIQTNGLTDFHHQAQIIVTRESPL